MVAVLVDSDATELLLLRRALGRATLDDYVAWAVDQLARNVDGPNLRILAGLSTRFDRDEIERYFVLSCRELGLSVTNAAAPVLDVARLVRTAHERGSVTAKEALEMMVDVYYSSGPENDELLAPWQAMRAALEWGEGSIYSGALTPLDAAIRHEWTLLERASRLSLPPGWLEFSRCSDCGHVGDIHVELAPLGARLLGAFKQQPAGLRALCEQCGSQKLTTLRNPAAREAYFDSLSR
ncbi:MAG: hypothetical protein QM756_02770 [Polyangiaceae bacterium]